MSDSTILLVDDSAEIIAINDRALQANGYRTHCAASMLEAERALNHLRIDLLVLDILLPDGSGIDFCRRMRPLLDIPIIMLTVLGEKEQIIQGLRAGADDYIVKPYSTEELCARIEAQLRQAKRLRHSALRLSYDDVQLDFSTQRAFYQNGDLMLKPKEFLLLAAFIRQPHQAFSAVELYTQVWGMHTFEDIRTVMVHISTLRSKLRRARCPLTIERLSDSRFILQRGVEL